MSGGILSAVRIKNGFLYVLAVLFAYLTCSYGQESVPTIPDAQVAALKQELEEGTREDADVLKRRAYKSVVRRAQSLLADAPEAGNRFALLAVVLECQKRLLAMQNSESHREAVFKTCAELAKAPDEFAEQRLEADLLLSEKELSDRNATMDERAQALADMIERYRNTAAESRSLLMGALIVQKLDAPELENAIYDVLDEKYADDHEVIAFRRDHLKVGRLTVAFEGNFEYHDGRACSLPEDALGHLSLMVFWSKDKPGIENLMSTVRKYQEQFPGRFTVFSLNVDGLQDGGQFFLKEHGYDWTVLKMPGGRGHPAYRTYAKGDAVAILVNEYGYAVLMPGYQTDDGGWRGERSGAFVIDGARISEARYTAQLQSLFIGDFLVWSEECEWRVASGERDSASSDSDKIFESFVEAPLRYRLSMKEALENYTRAAALAGDLLKTSPGGDSAAAVRNCRIVALMGMSSLACEPKHFEEAVKEAQSGMGSGAEVIPRFCLAKAALRSSDDTETVVTGFLKDCGGDTAPASALAAAAVLAIEARSRELHEKYRALFLEKHGDDPDFYAFSSFLRDRHHRFRLLQPNYTLRESRARGYIVGFGYPEPTNNIPSIALKNLDGSKLVIPEDTNGKLTYLLFVEPPADGKSDFPITLNHVKNPSRNDGIRQVMDYAERFSRSHVNKDINFVAAFLTDNAEHVRFLVQTNGWSCRAAMVPGGLSNPMVQQLGILSADCYPNVFVLRRDGSIAWSVSGLQYKNEFGYPFAVQLAMKIHVEACEAETAYTALATGDYKEAASVFSGPFPLAEPDRSGWQAPVYHGQALAYSGMNDWASALESIDKAIDAHKLHHFHGYGRRGKLSDWRKDAALVEMKEPCDILCMLWAAKADILDNLGRKDEATALRERSGVPPQVHRPNVYTLFHERLNSLKLNEKQEK